MKPKRRRLRSIEAAIAKLAPAILPQTPLVETPRCTTSPPCGHCWFCHVAAGGPMWWLKGIA